MGRRVSDFIGPLQEPLLVDQFGRRWYAFGDERWYLLPAADWIDVIAGQV